MATFSQLLNGYIERSGITDAELARSVGVRRQTIFRWKEGIVARPRHRDDVLRCADRLRLSPVERDSLLTAAGFAPESSPALPEDPTVPDVVAVDDTPQSVAEIVDDDGGVEGGPDEFLVSASPARPAILGQPWVWVGATLLVIVIAVVLVGAVTANLPTPDPTVIPTPTTLASKPTPALPDLQAEEGETLLLVADFANYANDAGYNVSGRLREALEQEIAAAHLISTTVQHWPEALTDSKRADEVVSATNAALLIWGEYDSGRVRAILSTDQASTDWERLLPNAADLTATINIDAPREVRSLAFLSLGQLYRNRDDIKNARNALKQVLEQQPAEDDIVANTKFYLATVLAAEPEPNFTAAIVQYDDVITLRPEWVNAHYNRGSAYLDRYYTPDGSNADLDAAIADLTWSIQRKPGFANAYLNRAIAYYERRLAGDLNQALIDLDRAAALAPDERRVRFNRGLARIRRGDEGWAEDFLTILEQDADSASAHNALCWGYALARDGELALPHCDQALALGLTRSVYDGRGIALAQLGRAEDAVASLQAYLDELSGMSVDDYERYNGPMVAAWIGALSAGENPFDRATLESLR